MGWFLDLFNPTTTTTSAPPVTTTTTSIRRTVPFYPPGYTAKKWAPHEWDEEALKDIVQTGMRLKQEGRISPETYRYGIPNALVELDYPRLGVDIPAPSVKPEHTPTESYWLTFQHWMDRAKRFPTKNPIKLGIRMWNRGANKASTSDAKRHLKRVEEAQKAYLTAAENEALRNYITQIEQGGINVR